MIELETALRATLHDRAARIHASPRLLGADYRPRTRRVRPRVAIGSGVLAAGGVLAAVLSLAGGAGTAFAGWTPQPTVPSRTQLAAAERYCANNAPDQGLRLQLTDTRGPFTILIYSDGVSNDFCTVGPSFRNASGWSTSPPVAPPTEKLLLWTDHTSTDGGHSYGSMIARAGDGVSAVQLTLDDGSVVTASVENGWVVAWWPGTHHVAAAQLATPSGTRMQTFPAYPCDLHNCHGGPHGGPARGVSSGG